MTFFGGGSLSIFFETAVKLPPIEQKFIMYIEIQLISWSFFPCPSMSSFVISFYFSCKMIMTASSSCMCMSCLSSCISNQHSCLNLTSTWLVFSAIVLILNQHLRIVPTSLHVSFPSLVFPYFCSLCTPTSLIAVFSAQIYNTATTGDLKRNS